MTLVFAVVPVGEVFGSSFLDYAKWAARGFADPAAHILLVWGVLAVVGAREGRRTASPMPPPARC